MSLLEAAQDARHDLGKYVCMNQRWLGPDPSPELRLEALQADVLHTHKGPDGSQSAVEIWAKLGPALSALPEAAAVDAAVGVLAEAQAALADGSIDPEQQRACMAACQTIQSTLKALTRRLQKEL